MHFASEYHKVCVMFQEIVPVPVPRTSTVFLSGTCSDMHFTLTGIFFDTYGEYYEDMREFHQHLPRLLRPGGIYSYFNGLCGDNAFFHVVYCQVVSLELANLGYSTQFIPLPVKDCLSKEIWEGVRQKYWQLDTYYLPVCQAECDSEWIKLEYCFYVYFFFKFLK